METLVNVLLIITMLGSLSLLIFGWVDMCKFTKRMKKDHESSEKLVEKERKKLRKALAKNWQRLLKKILASKNLVIKFLPI